MSFSRLSLFFRDKELPTLSPQVWLGGMDNCHLLELLCIEQNLYSHRTTPNPLPQFSVVKSDIVYQADFYFEV